MTETGLILASVFLGMFVGGGIGVYKSPDVSIGYTWQVAVGIVAGAILGPVAMMAFLIIRRIYIGA